MHDATTFQELIVKLGGISAVSEKLGLSVNTVAGMKRRNSIAPTYWPQFIALAQRKGIPLTTDQLLDMRNARAPEVAAE